jgi:tartrate dehydratase beta subunit/fumarate hydratase class I family protein
VEVLEYEDLGMEAVWKIEVEDFPAFIVINHEGKDFYADMDTQKAANLIQVSDSREK